MRVKTFEAASMQEALQTIKQDMGEEAYILSTKTRQQGKQGGAIIEVTAAVDDSAAPQTHQGQMQAAAPLQPKETKAGNPGGTYGLRPPLPSGADPARPMPSSADLARPMPPGADLARPMPPPDDAAAGTKGAWGQKPDSGAPKAPGALAKPKQKVIEPLDVPAPPERTAWIPVQQEPRPSPQQETGPPAGDEPTMDLQPIRRELLEIRGAVEALKGQDGRNGAVLAELDQLKGMLSRLQKHGLPALPHQLPPALLKLYGDLAANDVDPMIAVRLCEYTQRALAEQGGGGDVDHDKARLFMRRVISDFIPVAPPIQLDPAKVQVAALVGPSGVGKTSTIAKLAAFAKLNMQQSVALITLDVFRAGGAEQLQAHASAMQVPVHVCITAEDIRSALNFYQDRALVLIDTPGIHRACVPSHLTRQHDIQMMEKLAQLLDSVQPAETHLVLSATMKPRDLAEIALRFERLRPTRLLFTKLDETCTHGPILSTLARVRRPLSYLGTGQEIQHDLELATSRRVADLILPPAQVQP
jgi:flagellar biosynthesis protein FlhF